MKSQRLALAAGLAACCPTWAKPPLEWAPRGVEVAPVAIAKVKKVDGRIVLDGEWIPYTAGAGPRGGKLNTPFFDCYGHKPPLAPDCTPGTLCVPSCDTAPDSGGRWYFGTAYHNPNTIEDMQDCACPPHSVISEIALGFMWASPRPASPIIVFFPYEEVLGDDGAFCTDPATFTDTGGGGVAMNFGTLPPPHPFYWWACVTGVEALGVLSPGTDHNGDPNGYADGSYHQIFAESVTSTGIILSSGPCQPMLWGTSTNGTGPADCRPGHNGALSYDDDAPTDSVHTSAECYDYTFGVCPDPLGKDNCFSYLRCPADFNNDGFVDGIDADWFVNTFEAVPGWTPSCADLNGDCFVDGIDADLFYAKLEAPCP